jgi:hypothetical protein
MTALRAERPATPVQTLLRRAAIPATAETIVDLESQRPVALKVLTTDPGEPMDAVTMVRTLHAMASDGRPTAPLVFEVPIGTLLTVVPAGHHSDHPMILSVAADHLLDHPAESLRLVERARELGWEIGLHGVGRSPATLTAVSVFEPCLVTLATETLADPTSPLAVETLQTVTGFRHATGATVMAEPLDSAAVRHTALSLGATIGRGRAVPCAGRQLPAELDYTLDLFVSPRRPEHRMSPYEISIQRHQSQRAYRPVLRSLSRRIERTAQAAESSSILLSSFQHGRYLTPPVLRRYAELAERAELVMIAAGGLRKSPLDGVSWAHLSHHDNLRREWTVLLLSPTTSMLLAAREVRAAHRHDEPEYDYVLSYDRDLVSHAARSLLRRLPKRAPATTGEGRQLGGPLLGRTP